MIIFPNFFNFFLISYFFHHLNQISCTKINKNQWKDPISGKKYDWSSLHKKEKYPYEIMDPEKIGDYYIKYFINIGGYQPFSCDNKKSSVVEKLHNEEEFTDICEILGQYTSSNVGLLDENNPQLGIYLEYGDGDICHNSEDPKQNGLPRKTKLKIYCSKKQDKNFILDFPEQKQGVTKCLMEFIINSPAGCPVEKKIKSTNILMIIIFGFGVYIFGGYFINTKFYNKQGKHAIPNFFFWINFNSYVREGLFLVINQSLKMAKVIKYKFLKYFNYFKKDH